MKNVVVLILYCTISSITLASNFVYAEEISEQKAIELKIIGSYMGFEHKYLSGIPSYCKSLGVDTTEMVTRFNKINARVIEIIRKKLPLELYAENLSEDLKEKYQYITKESFEKNEPPPYQLVSY